MRFRCVPVRPTARGARVMTRRCCGFAVLWAVVLLPGCGGPTWDVYTPEDGTFTVEMPTTPEVKQDPNGWQTLSSTLEEEGAVFVLRYRDFPTPLTLGQ